MHEGATIPPHYDSLIAKLLVWDADRPLRSRRALGALGELEVAGIPTTRDLALDILRSEAFANGRYSTSYLEEMEAQLPIHCRRR